jgi:hypothetical protein
MLYMLAFFFWSSFNHWLIKNQYYTIIICKIFVVVIMKIFLFFLLVNLNSLYSYDLTRKQKKFKICFFKGERGGGRV